MLSLLRQYSALLWFVIAAYSPATNAVECELGIALGHTFSSGANWQYCAILDDNHALELQELHYKAPGDNSRKVLQHLHLGQMLLQEHDKISAEALVGNNALGGSALVTIKPNTCTGDIVSTPKHVKKLCTTTRPMPLMAKYSKRTGLHGAAHQVFSVSLYQGLSFTIMISLTEDGRIVPSVTLSGKQIATSDNVRYGQLVNDPITEQEIISTSLSLLSTWRMVFALNGDQQNDIVEEFNFTLKPELGSRRPMEVTEFSTEVFRNINREAFRGWRVRDPSGQGYYLDPQNSGYIYRDRQNNWAQFDLAISGFNDCEKHSLVNSIPAERIQNSCIGSLDQFINGQSLADTNPTLWYSLYRIHRPNASDIPAITAMTSEFELIPFDWTLTSPFEVIGE